MTNTTADVTVYENEKWLYPIWKGDTVYAETAFILKNALGEIRPKRLAYPIKKIISVRSFDLKTVYEEGKDYEINEYGELQVLPGGKIPYLNWNEYRFSEFVQDDVHMPSADALGAQCVRELFADKDGMSAYVLAVTYTHEPDDYYDVTAGKSEKFPRTIGKLKSGKDIKIALYGDSITYGWGASGMHDIAKPPFTPPYHEMAAQYIESKFHIKAERENFAVSGMCADWGIKEENAGKAAAYKPDLVILAFGMNDAGVFRPETFATNIQIIIDRIRKDKADAEFLLVSPILPNAETAFTAGSSILTYHREYPRAFVKLERGNSAVACANVTKMHELLLERKALADTLSNNVNHPNDFMHRIQAQTVLKTLLSNDFA